MIHTARNDGFRNTGLYVLPLGREQWIGTVAVLLGSGHTTDYSYSVQDDESFDSF